MKKLAVLICLVAFSNHLLMAWGFLGHQTINNRAVYALPPELFGFYKQYLDYITKHSTDPDSRRYLIEEEGCRHYLDCDHYEKSAPLDTIPHNWYNAVEKYTKDTLTEHGIVPWHILSMKHWLTKAFEEKNLQKILKYSADIGHYIADAHVPLHSSSNYNGQHSGQEGIHALWESRIPKLFLDSFDLLTGTVSYLDNPSDFIWARMSESFACTDSVFKLEILATSMHPENKYSFEPTGNTTSMVYSREYCNTYDFLMQDMVSRRMQQSIQAVAAFWYTAWVDAGMPDLSGFVDTPAQTEEEIAAEKAKELNKIKGREEHGKE